MSPGRTRHERGSPDIHLNGLNGPRNQRIAPSHLVRLLADGVRLLLQGDLVERGDRQCGIELRPTSRSALRSFSTIARQAGASMCHPCDGAVGGCRYSELPWLTQRRSALRRPTRS